MKRADRVKQIVIIGGGSAGIMLANRLRKQVKQVEAGIIVIEKSPEHFYQSGFLTLLFDVDKPDSLSRPVEDLLNGDITLISDEARKINLEGKVTTARSGEIPFDYLIIATGAKLFLDEPEGLKEGLAEGKSVFSFYTLDHALKLHDALRRFSGGTIVSCICEMPIKCPAAPVELLLLAEAEMRRRGIRDKCRFLLVTPTPSVPPNVEPYAGYVEQLLRDRNIEVVTEFTPSKIDGKKGLCEDFLGDKIEFDLLSVIPPHTGESLIQNSEGLGDPMGWVTCNKSTLRHRDFDNIYAIGDAASLPAGKTATAAEKQVVTLAQRITDLIHGKEPTATYDGTTVCPILTEPGRALFAAFDYSGSRGEAVESRMNWYRHVYLSRWRYWNVALKGKMKS
jgi:sulfide:quinone oxidoreductase